jgi:hypothetical protein
VASVALRGGASDQRCEGDENDIVRNCVITLNATCDDVITKASSPSTSIPTSFDVSGNTLTMCDAGVEDLTPLGAGR